MPVVVIIDDQATNRKIFSRIATSIAQDIKVHAFAEARAALQFAAEQIPDLIITDYKMPEMDGAAFIRKFRELPHCAEIPVIVITVYEERAFRMNALEAGATDFLQSPVDHQEFVTRARNLLQLRRQQLLLAAHASRLEVELQDSERSRELAIRDSSTRLAQVIDTVPAMICATDKDGKILFSNAMQNAVAGVAATDLAGQDISVLLGHENGKRFRALDRKVLRSETTLTSIEEEVTDAAGIRRVFLTTKMPLRDHADRVVGVLTSALDISERKRAEEYLLHVAQHDALTGIANRTLFMDRLRREIARARRGNRCFAVHIIDLDGFKSVNDAFGHSVGDKYLKAISQRLQELARNTDTVARLSGDEFAVLQIDIARGEDAAELATRITAEIAAPLVLDGHAVSLTASIGVAVHPSDAADANEMIHNAGLAMHGAKADGGNLFCFFAANMNKRARDAVMLDHALREAIKENQFELVYQPQVDGMTGAVVGAEALLRWNRPGHGLIGSTKFLARAEENGLIVPINEWVLREACRQGRAWCDEGLPPIRISVNMSPVQFKKVTVPLLVANVLSETRFAAENLELELVESIMMEDSEAVHDDVAQLSDLGVTIAIDDFGTGYSSLNYIKRFPASRIKIDQCFVRDIPRDPNDMAIVRTIISLAHSLELKVVAEGVETIEQAKFLQIEGCDELQGYHFGRPMKAEKFAALLKRGVPQLATA